MSKLIGNAVVGQSGGPTSAINATLAGVVRGAAWANKEGTINKLYGMKHGVQGLLEENLIDLSYLFGNEEEIVLLESTPAAALKSCRKRLPPLEETETYEKLLTIFKKYDIRYFFYIGGNDSMDTVAKLSAYMKDKGYEMRFMGVPKTVDNDLVGTDHTPGFGSAAKYIATTMQEIMRDISVYTSQSVTIVEIMGRDAGWLTSAAGLPRLVSGDAVDLIYLPERNFDMEKFFEDVKAALKKHPNVLVAVSEGVHFANGDYVGAATSKGVSDAFGHKYLSGTSNALKNELSDKLGIKVRAIELNVVQRCAAHSASKTDITESVRIGARAVRYAVDGVTGHMVCMNRTPGVYDIDVDSKDVSHLANQVKNVPDEFINAEGNNVTDACLEYLLPLIKGETNPPYVSGLPKHFKLPN